jgi:hypothetical protein
LAIPPAAILTRQSESTRTILAPRGCGIQDSRTTSAITGLSFSGQDFCEFQWHFGPKQPQIVTGGGGQRPTRRATTQECAQSDVPTPRHGVGRHRVPGQRECSRAARRFGREQALYGMEVALLQPPLSITLA